jgi:hypothetical protein
MTEKVNAMGSHGKKNVKGGREKEKKKKASGTNLNKKK